MDVCVVLVVRTIIWNVKWHEGRKGFKQYKNGSKGKNPRTEKKKTPVGANFFHPSRAALGPTRPPVQQVLVFPGGKEVEARRCPTPPHLAPRLKKSRVTLLLCDLLPCCKVNFTFYLQESENEVIRSTTSSAETLRNKKLTCQVCFRIECIGQNQTELTKVHA
jgi:hypothetical protein